MCPSRSFLSSILSHSSPVTKLLKTYNIQLVYNYLRIFLLCFYFRITDEVVVACKLLNGHLYKGKEIGREQMVIMLLNCVFISYSFCRFFFVTSHCLFFSFCVPFVFCFALRLVLGKCKKVLLITAKKNCLVFSIWRGSRVFNFFECLLLLKCSSLTVKLCTITCQVC